MTATAVEAAASRPARGIKGLVESSLGYGILLAGESGLVANFVKDPGQSSSALVDGINNGALYALIALGYTLVYGIIELINFAHGDLFMLGSVFSAFFLVNWLGVNRSRASKPCSRWSSRWSPRCCSAERSTSRPNAWPIAGSGGHRSSRRSSPRSASASSSSWVGLQWNGSAPQQWPSVVKGGFSIGSVNIDYTTILVIAVTVPLLLLLTWIVQGTRQGKAMRATAQDQDAARLMGVNVDRTIAFTFALGGAMAGAAGMSLCPERRHDAL